jgi:hypothetical protein
LADIFRLHGPAYIEKFGDRIPKRHIKVMENIVACRTEKLGGEVFLCESCQEYRYSYHSCQDRHCPKCGNEKAGTWLTKQRDMLLPVPYFLVTFTLPHTLNALARSHQNFFYNTLFHAAAQALQKLARDPHHIGGQIGFFGVLHTWMRDLGYHPHVHFIVAGGALSEDGLVWLPAQEKFFLPVHALSKIFRGIFHDALKKKPDLQTKAPQHTWKKDWVVHCEPIGSGEHALKYLTPYIFRVAIGNKRLIKLEKGNVMFQYRDGKTNQCKIKTVPTEEFIRRFLQHVLPHRFCKVRYYGFLSARHRQRLKKVNELLLVVSVEIESTTMNNDKAPDDEPTLRVMCCPKCNGEMHWSYSITPRQTRAP